MKKRQASSKPTVLRPSDVGLGEWTRRGGESDSEYFAWTSDDTRVSEEAVADDHIASIEKIAAAGLPLDIYGQYAPPGTFQIMRMLDLHALFGVDDPMDRIPKKAKAERMVLAHILKYPNMSPKERDAALHRDPGFTKKYRARLAKRFAA